MLYILGFVAIACMAVISYVVSTAAAIGVVEILVIAIFGFAAIVCMIAFTVFAMGKYAKHKASKAMIGVKSKVKNFTVKKLTK